MKQREKLGILGKRILNASRTELTLSMRFLAAPLNTLDYVMDLATTTVGTDASFIRFNPNYLFRLYVEEPAHLNRTYLHMLLHCLFAHMFSVSRFPDTALWNLSCDIAVESLIDGMDNDAIRRVTSDFREQVYDTLKKEVRVLTAEKIYDYLMNTGMNIGGHEFLSDDHAFWERLNPSEDKNDSDDKQPSLPDIPLPPARLRLLKEQWARDAQRVRSELDLLSKEASKETGSLAWTLAALTDTRTDFRQYLRTLAVVREEARPDPDSFHYGMYRYGLSLYGNMPLIEELEVREAKKIDTLVIAIDTSASCAREQVQTFLNETVALLKRQETFFHRVDVRIIECDDRVQHEIAFTDVADITRYADAFTLKGGFGTDFRPVFRHIADLRAHGELKNLRGLLYFTDGYGVFPTEAAPYDTAFVFDTQSDYSDRDVPPWAMKLYI
ncbi:MAG: metallopeptidase [Lachnospiraceae bacterium]|nr:metallopeptidase [Lachnospiraceae bacterium]